MSQLAWFIPPRSIGSPSERRRCARYPAGPSLRGRLDLPRLFEPIQAHVYSISTAGFSLVVERPVGVNTVGTLRLTNADRDLACTLGVRFCHSTRYRGDLMAGGVFERELTKEELEGLTPTLSLWLEIEPVGDVVVGRFTRPDLGEDHAVRIIGEQLFGLVEELGQRHFMLDFGPVRRVNCSLLSQLLEFRRRVNRVSGRLALFGLDPLVQHVFEATSLTRVFRIFETETEALQSFEFLALGHEFSAP